MCVMAIQTDGIAYGADGSKKQTTRTGACSRNGLSGVMSCAEYQERKDSAAAA